MEAPGPGAAALAPIGVGATGKRGERDGATADKGKAGGAGPPADANTLSHCPRFRAAPQRGSLGQRLDGMRGARVSP